MKIPDSVKNRFGQLSPRVRQWVMATALLCAGFGLLWAVIAISQPSDQNAGKKVIAKKATDSRVTNIGVMTPGAQVTARDQWVGTAGKKLAQWEHDRSEMDRKAKEAEEFQRKTLLRFAELEKTAQQRGAKSSQGEDQSAVGARDLAGSQEPPGYPPPSALINQGPQSLPPPPKASSPGNGAAGEQNAVASVPVDRSLVRVSVAPPAKAPVAGAGTANAPGQKREAPYTSNVDTYLPVSFTRGVMLGGIDAPTGGQSQSNPHPVIIRLEDNAVLPNRSRSNVRECFVIAAGYGDISSERAYMRTESLSCVRNDGSTLEVKISGVIYGDDGHVGVRGRLVEKQGQILAKALLAGLLSGVGQGLAAQGTTTTTSLLGASTTTDSTHAYQQGIGKGVGNALDRLANYYIRLAEQIFPVIEVDAGRMVDVVITKGVRIEGGEPQRAAGVDAVKQRLAGVDDDY